MNMDFELVRRFQIATGKVRFLGTIHPGKSILGLRSTR